MWIVRFISLLLFVIMIVALIALVFRIQRMRHFAAKRKTGAMPADDGLRQLIADGQMDEAVDLYSRFTGLDTASSLHIIREMAKEMGVLPDVRYILPEGDEIGKERRS